MSRARLKNRKNKNEHECQQLGHAAMTIANMPVDTEQDAGSHKAK